MPNPRLNDAQLKRAHKLLEKIRKEIVAFAENDPELIFAFRRKIYKELMYDERSRPLVRRNLKRKIWEKQKGVCAVCKKELPAKNSVLDRFEAIGGYTEQNVRLLHKECDERIQSERGYK